MTVIAIERTDSLSATAAGRRLVTRPGVRYDDVAAVLTQGLSLATAGAVMPDTLAATWARVELLAQRGPAATIEARGPGDSSAPGAARAVLAVGGVAERLAGVAEAWAIVGVRVPELGWGFRVVRAVRRLLDQWLAAGPWRRVDCGVPAAPATVEKFLAWVRALGFEPEARLAQACADGGDLIVCVRLPREEVC
jgi:hypothetical protein